MTTAVIMIITISIAIITTVATAMTITLAIAITIAIAIFISRTMTVTIGKRSLPHARSLFAVRKSGCIRRSKLLLQKLQFSVLSCSDYNRSESGLGFTA